jgi:hypothetical protein
MTLDEWLTNKEATYMFKVNGESMIERRYLPAICSVERGQSRVTVM